MAAGEMDDPALKRGVAFLQKTQGEHGLWDEARYNPPPASRASSICAITA